MNAFPLHEAVLTANLRAVEAAIASGLDLNALDENGHAPLHWAAFGGYDEIALMLLQAGANPNVFSWDGVTPAWRAADFGFSDLQQLLCRYGGKVATNPDFDRSAFQIFSKAIGQPLPQEEPLPMQGRLAVALRKLLRRIGM